MDGQPSRSGPATAGREAVRLRLVASASDLGDADLLTLALQQAVAALGGLGGMVHRCEGANRRLRLEAASGLPREAAEPWEDLAWDEVVAPALAVREQRFVWMPLDTAASGRSAFSLPEDAGLAAVPLPGPDRPLGALTVLTTAPEPPRQPDQVFLTALADLLGGCLRRGGAGDAAGPTWWRNASLAHLSPAMWADPGGRLGLGPAQRKGHRRRRRSPCGRSEPGYLRRAGRVVVRSPPSRRRRRGLRRDRPGRGRPKHLPVGVPGMPPGRDHHLGRGPRPCHVR